MPPYEQMHAEHLVYILLGGILLLGLVWLAMGSHRWTVSFKRRSEEELRAREHDFGDVREGHRPVPLFLLVLVILFVLWAIGYTWSSGSGFPY